jgi:hypothetical protein
MAFLGKKLATVAAEPSDEFAASKKDAHLALPCEPVDQAGAWASTGGPQRGRFQCPWIENPLSGLPGDPCGTFLK